MERLSLWLARKLITIHPTTRPYCRCLTTNERFTKFHGYVLPEYRTGQLAAYRVGKQDGLGFTHLMLVAIIVSYNTKKLFLAGGVAGAIAMTVVAPMERVRLLL